MRIVLVTTMLLALAGCASNMAPKPVGVGDGINELRKSPCACTEIPMQLPKEFSA